MKILFLTNNEISKPLYHWLIEDKNETVIYWNKKVNVDFIKRNKIDFVISYNYKYLIKQEIIDLVENRIINLHISLLPWNRGASPNIWSFIDDTLKGVSIHRIDSGLDTGDILLQRQYNFDVEVETLSSTYNKLQVEIQNLFKENWDNLKNNHLVAIKQQGEGSFHKTKDLCKYEHVLDYNKPIKEFVAEITKVKGELNE